MKDKIGKQKITQDINLMKEAKREKERKRINE